MALSITKPTVGGSEDTWGTTINTALDDIVSYANTAPQLGDANVFTAAQTVSADLTVDGSGIVTLTVESTGATHDPVLALKNDNGGAAEWTARLDKSDSNKFQLQYNTTDHLTIATDGKVGVGTSSPGQELDVQSTGDTTLRVKANSSGAGNDDDAFLRLDAAETGEAVVDFYLDGSDVGYSIEAAFPLSQMNYNVPTGATHDFQVNGAVEARVEGGKGIVADNTIKAWARVENGAIAEDFGFSSISAASSAYTLSFDGTVFAPGNGNYGVIATSTENATYVAAATSRAANGVDLTITVWDVVNNTGVSNADFTVMVLNT